MATERTVWVVTRRPAGETRKLERQVSVPWCAVHDTAQGDFSVFGYKDMCPVFLFADEEPERRCDVQDGRVWRVVEL